MVFTDKVLPWVVSEVQEISIDLLKPVVAEDKSIEILLIGCGANSRPPPNELYKVLKFYNVALEWMTTDAACRTFNVLLAEDRRVAAGLVGVE